MKTMKKIIAHATVFLILVQFSTVIGQEVNSSKLNEGQNLKHPQLKTFLIEREIPDAGNLSAEDLRGISQKSCAVIKEMGPEIQWLHSYVTDDKVYCLYKAENKDLIRQHAEAGGFPVNYITELAIRIDPSTAN